MPQLLPPNDEAVHYLSVAILHIVHHPDGPHNSLAIANAITAIAKYAAARATALKDLDIAPPTP